MSEPTLEQLLAAAEVARQFGLPKDATGTFPLPEAIIHVCTGPSYNGNTTDFDSVD